MKNVVLFGRQSYFCFIAVSLCFNLIFGGIFIYHSSGSGFKWGHNALKAIYYRETVNVGILNNKSMMGSMGKQTSSSTTQSYGYVLPYVIYEQQTSSARNLWGLQYWANTVGMKVVEPFYTERRLSFESIVMGIPNPMRFGDLYDVDYWNNQSTKRNCSELVTWENFLSNASKRVILVLNRGLKPTSGNSKAGIVDVVDNPDDIVGRRSCGDSDVEFSENALTYFKRNGFDFVREVCITFNSSVSMSVGEYSSHILGKFSSDQVTVIFAFWHGIRERRLNLRGITLDNANTVEIGLLPSRAIVQASERYLHKLKLSKAGSQKYFGVMVRIEKIFLTFVIQKKITSFEKFVEYMMKCATDLKHLEEFNKHKKWGRTLAIDLGRYGSVGFLKHDNEAHRAVNGLYQTFFSSIFGDKNWSIDEYERSFKKYLDTEDPVYIAQVQRTIAARSDCLILVGGESTYQSVAISFYKNFHPNIKQQCIIKHCYYDYDLDLNTFLQKKNAKRN